MYLTDHRVPRAILWSLISSALGVGACSNEPAEVLTLADACPFGQLQCGVLCVDPEADFYNCGGCGTTCTSGQSCIASQCQCQPGQGDCDPGMPQGDTFAGGSGVAELAGPTGPATGGASEGTGTVAEGMPGSAEASTPPIGGSSPDTETATTGGEGGEPGDASGESGDASGQVGGTTGGEVALPVPTGGTPVINAELPPHENYTEEVNGVPFDMVYVPGGTFDLGCEGEACPQYADTVSGVVVSSYLIGKNEVTNELWAAVMGESASGFGATQTSITWYEAMEFSCLLSQMTGLNFRMMTEAEFEYAAKNHLSSLEDIGAGEEWAYNSWETSHTGGTDPVGPNSGEHTQKTRRDAQGTADNITGRLIRSIDGVGPALRLVISAETDFPPEYVSPCDLHAPSLDGEPENSYRDPRWITGSEAHWTTGSIAIGNLDLRVWDDGTAQLGNTDGQWFTSNNIAFVFVSSSGKASKYAYIFLDETQGSVISDQGFMSGGYIGRFEKEAVSGDKPSIPNLRSGAELAAEAGSDYKMVDMVNLPEAAKQQDSRLLDGATQGWFQDNTQAGGVHHYRKDVDPDEFRFTVNQGQMTVLASGTWFTVNNTFLRITHADGYVTDYLYAIDENGAFLHNSFQAYERADFRMFELKSNSDAFPASCGSHCSSEIPKGESASIYATLDNGHSTFVPAPCPAGGCE